MNYTATGIVHKVGEAQQKSERLRVQEFRIKTDGQYPQILRFQLMNDRCDLIHPYPLGTSVSVTFEIRGKENEETGNCYTNLNAWKIQPA